VPWIIARQMAYVPLDSLAFLRGLTTKGGGLPEIRNLRPIRRHMGP